MHIPDGLLNDKLATGLGFAAATALGYALHHVWKKLTEPALQRAMVAVGRTTRLIKEGARRTLSAAGNEYLAKVGLVASLIFSLQMFNFPVTNGTSGHFIGGVFAAILLGPWGGVLAMTVVLGIQAIFYADGGLLALGANIINMGMVTSILGYYSYVLLRKVRVSPILAIGITAWFSVVAAAAACSIELGFSGTYGLTQTLQAMLPVHMLIGIGEALLTICFLQVAKYVMGWKEYRDDDQQLEH